MCTPPRTRLWWSLYVRVFALMDRSDQIERISLPGLLPRSNEYLVVGKANMY